MSQMVNLTLCIREAAGEGGPAFLYHIQLDGKVLASNLSISAEDARALRRLARDYLALFEPPRVARLSLQAQRALGRELFDLWLGPHWGEITSRLPPGAHCRIVIASALPDILNLPWELLRPPDGDFLAFDPRFSFRRFPRPDGLLPSAPPTSALPAGPLRVLFFVAAPVDLVELDYEGEEKAVLDILGRLGIEEEVAFYTNDLGSFEELQDMLNRLRPQVVHLTGHGALGRRCPQCRHLNRPEDIACRSCGLSLEGVPVLGHFAFEDEGGHSDPRSSLELWRDCLVRSGVQAVFVSGCQTGCAPDVAALGGIA